MEPIMTTEIEERASDPPAPILTRYVNLCDKYTLTIEEAAAYFGIGQKKIRSLVQTHENDDFILHVGVKVLIKRKIWYTHHVVTKGSPAKEGRR